MIFHKKIMLVKRLGPSLVPAEFEVDDFQVRTPTDIIGQHIHLPKWDLTTNDGAANGWNYEDGTLSPGAVVERIIAINHFNGPNDGDHPLPSADFRRRLGFAAVNFSLVDFDKSLQLGAAGVHHGTAQLGFEQPSRRIAEAELVP